MASSASGILYDGSSNLVLVLKQPPTLCMIEDLILFAILNKKRERISQIGNNFGSQAKSIFVCNIKIKIVGGNHQQAIRGFLWLELMGERMH